MQMMAELTDSGNLSKKINGEIPDVLFDRYKVEKKLGEGGMGVVYKAHDPLLDQDVSIKLLRQQNNIELSALRFQREAKAASALRHKNLATVLDFGISEDHTLYMVSTYIDAVNLKDFIRKNGALPVKQALSILVQISDSMEYIHSKNILHRDIKSSNILINEKSAYLLDFGIAKTSETEKLEENLTHTGDIIGSPHYLSPNQAMGQEANTKSDIYSLGCVAFEMLTGETPFSGETAVDIIYQQIESEVPSLKERTDRTDIPDDMVGLVESMLAKDQRNRPESMTLIKDTFSAILEEVEDSESPKEKPGKEENTEKILTSLRSIGELKYKKSFLALLLVSVLTYTGITIFNMFKPVDTTVHQSEGVEETTHGLAPGFNAEIEKELVIKPQFRKESYIRSVGDTEYITIKMRPNAEGEKIDWSELDKYQEKFYLNADYLVLQKGDLEAILSKPNLIGVNLANCKNLDDKSLELIAQKRKDLRLLKLARQPVITARGLERLTELKALNQMEVTSCALDLNKVKAIAKIKSLYLLKIKSEPLFDDQILKYVFANMPNLVSLNIDECPITGMSLDAAAKLKKLAFLHLVRTKLNDEGLEKLAHSGSQIMHLSLTDSLITKEGFKQLRFLKNLKEIEISSCKNISKAEVETYSKLFNLKYRMPKRQEQMESFFGNQL